MEVKKTGFVGYLFIMVKWRKFIIINFIIVCLITAIISLIIPKTFTATTTILPPAKESEGFGLSQFISNLPMGGFGMAGISEETYIVLAIINSRTVMEAIVKKFSLIDLYEAKNMEEAVKTLRENVKVEVNENGTVSLFASAKTCYFAVEKDENRTRQLATDIANEFIFKLDKVNIQLKIEKAANTRAYIEKRYLENLSDLKSAEEKMKTFQQKYGIIALTEQTAAAINAAAELNANITMKEIEVSVLSKYVSNSHSKLVRTKKELNELRKKYEEMRSGSTAELGGGKKDVDLFIPFDEVPELGLQYVRLYREVTLQEKLLEFLLPQYEQAKIQEAKDTPTIQVLDEAVPPILRSSPKRALLVIIMGMVSVFVSLIIILIIEYLNRIKYVDENEYNMIENIMLELRNDYKRLVHKIRPRKSLTKGNMDE